MSELIFTRKEVETLAAFAKNYENGGEMLVKFFYDGHSGGGLYVADAEYPEEGFMFLGEQQEQGRRR